MDHEAAVARAAKFGSPKFRIISLLIHATIVVVVTMLLTKLPHAESITFSRGLKIVGVTVMITAATATFTQLRRAGHAKRMLKLMGGQQLCFAVTFLAGFLPSETAALVVTCISLTLCIALTFLVLREQRTFRVRLEAQTAASMRAIERARATRVSE